MAACDYAESILYFCKVDTPAAFRFFVKAETIPERLETIRLACTAGRKIARFDSVDGTQLFSGGFG